MQPTYAIAGHRWMRHWKGALGAREATKIATAIRKAGGHAMVLRISLASNVGGLTMAEKRKHKGKFLVWERA